jgi:hypothetical protein
MEISTNFIPSQQDNNNNDNSIKVIGIIGISFFLFYLTNLNFISDSSIVKLPIRIQLLEVDSTIYVMCVEVRKSGLVGQNFENMVKNFGPGVHYQNESGNIRKVFYSSFSSFSFSFFFKI